MWITRLIAMLPFKDRLTVCVLHDGIVLILSAVKSLLTDMAIVGQAVAVQKIKAEFRHPDTN